MGFSGFNSGANVIAYKKNNKNYAMTCAWAMLVDYDKAMMLLGSQSDTGNNIEVGDIIGISGLASNQKDVALILGENHSSSKDKLEGISYKEDDTAILINDAKTNMKAKVLEVIHTKENPEDNLVYVEFISTSEDENKSFLATSDVF